MKPQNNAIATALRKVGYGQSQPQPSPFVASLARELKRNDPSVSQTVAHSEAQRLSNLR